MNSRAAATSSSSRKHPSGVPMRGPLLLLLALGCTVSMLASGLFTPRLIADGAVSFAFVPVCEIAGVTAVWWRRRARASWSQAVDAAFDNNLPWLIWLLAAMALNVIVPVVELGAWILPLLVSSAVPIAWAAYLDFKWSRTSGAPTAAAATADAALARAVAWPLAILYFVGTVLLSDIFPTTAGWFRR